MKLVDLDAQQARIRDGVRKRIDAVLAHGQYILGPEVVELERELAAYVGVAHAVGVSDGTTALLVALMALGVGRGDEVVTTPFTFVASAEVIALLGATPVFVDIDRRTYNIDPAGIGAAITSRTRAVIPVGLFGQCADMDTVAEAARGLPVIEDAAQSFGAMYRGRRSGGLSRIGCTSFFPSKPLGCYGDGGACFTDDAALAERIRSIRAHGQSRRYVHDHIGLNGRLDTLQAAVLLAKLEIFDDEIVRRDAVAGRYAAAFAHRVQTQQLPAGQTSVFAQYTIELERRDAFVEAATAAGIPTAVHYPVPLHEQPAFAELGARSFPVAEQVSARVVSLPMHPYLSAQDQDAVIDLVLRFTDG